MRTWFASQQHLVPPIHATRAASADTHQSIRKSDGTRCRFGFLLTLEFVGSGLLKLGCELPQVLVEALYMKKEQNKEKITAQF